MSLKSEGTLHSSFRLEPCLHNDYHSSLFKFGPEYDKAAGRNNGMDVCCLEYACETANGFRRWERCVPLRKIFLQLARNTYTSGKTMSRKLSNFCVNSALERSSQWRIPHHAFQSLWCVGARSRIDTAGAGRLNLERLKVSMYLICVIRNVPFFTAIMMGWAQADNRYFFF